MPIDHIVALVLFSIASAYLAFAWYKGWIRWN